MKTATTFALVVASAVAVGLFMQPDAKAPAAAPMPVVAEPQPVQFAPPPQAPMPIAQTVQDEAALEGYPWIVAGGTNSCPFLSASPYTYIDLIRADGVRVDIMSEGPNHVTIGDTSKSPAPIQIIVRGMSCDDAHRALKVMRAY